MLAIVAYQRGDCQLAIVHFEKAGGLFDSQLDGLHAYATCLMRLKEFDRAAQVLQRALLLSPNDLREHQVLAAVQLRGGQPERALSTLEPLLQASPDAQTLELAATAHEDARNTPEAVKLLQRAILMDPHNVNLYVDFALISAAHQSNQVGINVVSDGITQEPSASALYLARGVLYAQLDQYDKAEADFERANDLDPSQSLSTAAQGLAAMQKNDLDQALASVEERLAKRPNDPALLYLQGDILAQKGFGPDSPEFATAMRSAKKAVSLQPALGPAHDVLAKLFLRAGDYKAAAQECRLALKIDAADQTALYRLIQALRKDGDNQETPELVKRLAALRQQSTKEERERNRYRLADD
jgi:tetratricopeptide (TPR) repeat protein